MITMSGRRRSASATAASPSDGLADHADVRRAGEREAQPLADDLVVVGDQAGDGGSLFCHSISGRGGVDTALYRQQHPRVLSPGCPERVTDHRSTPCLAGRTPPRRAPVVALRARRRAAAAARADRAAVHVARAHRRRRARRPRATRRRRRRPGRGAPRRSRPASRTGSPGRSRAPRSWRCCRCRRRPAGRAGPPRRRGPRRRGSRGEPRRPAFEVVVEHIGAEPREHGVQGHALPVAAARAPGR